MIIFHIDSLKSQEVFRSPKHPPENGVNSVIKLSRKDKSPLSTVKSRPNPAEVPNVASSSTFKADEFYNPTTYFTSMLHLATT